jgi:hypothetical protein
MTKNESTVDDCDLNLPESELVWEPVAQIQVIATWPPIMSEFEQLQTIEW